MTNLHAYHYAGNNPVRYTDPDGRDDVPSWKAKEQELAQEMEQYLEELRQSQVAYPDPDSRSPEMKQPAEGYKSDLFGYRGILTLPDGRKTSNAFHGGIDIANAIGTPVNAALTGTVLDVDYSPSYGNYVIIGHDKNGWGGTITLYGHLNKPGIVKKGDAVVTGQKIGEMGKTGLADGSHLHFEVRVNGEKKDPQLYIKFRFK
jgi:murein DD-endopeptidase MepM/ murein hydrolase activator NlpD